MVRTSTSDGMMRPKDGTVKYHDSVPDHGRLREPDNDHARRLLDGMARAVAAKGYGDATIADIVREAGVSRRTFYEHFTTKAECLIALYEMASLRGLDVLRKAIDGAPALGRSARRSAGGLLRGHGRQSRPVANTLHRDPRAGVGGVGGTSAREPADRRVHPVRRQLAVSGSQAQARRRKWRLQWSAGSTNWC